MDSDGAVISYDVDPMLSGGQTGRCPVCRADRLLTKHQMQASLLGAGGLTIAYVHRCTTCGTYLRDTPLIARIALSVLLLGVLFMLGLAVWAFGPFALGLFGNPREAGLLLWALFAGLFGFLGYGIWAVVRGLRRLWRSRFVEMRDARIAF